MNNRPHALMHRFLAFVLAATFVLFANAQQLNLPQKWIRVSVAVSAPETMRSETISFLTRELRALGDVEIVEDTPTYRVEVVALETASRASTEPTGYAISAIVTRPVNLTLAKTAFELYGQGVDAELRSNLFKITEKTSAGHEQILGHYLRIGPSDGLAKLCEGLIASIDGETFENARKGRQQAIKEIEQMRKEQQSKKP